MPDDAGDVCTAQLRLSSAHAGQLVGSCGVRRLPLAVGHAPRRRYVAFIALAAIVSVAEEGNEPASPIPATAARCHASAMDTSPASAPSSDSVVACCSLATAAAYISYIAPAAVGEASAKLRLSLSGHDFAHRPL